MGLDNRAVLLLEDGTKFVGRSVAAIGTSTGELCFNTGMTGYQEIFTDPSYFGQILISTNVHMGNYGANNEETESSQIQISGLVCRDFAQKQFRKQADEPLDSFMKNQGLVGIQEVDTRALVRHIRQKGAMNAVISSEQKTTEELADLVRNTPKMKGLELASKVSTNNPYNWGDESSEFRIAALDFGIKKSILNCFSKRNCFIRIFPAQSSFEEMQAWNPTGYFLSNGPGDPAAMDYATNTVRKILDKNIPLFGICLGHQILGLTAGASTYKLHHGHRGINHPVKNLVTGRSEITSQNHGFGVAEERFEKLKESIIITHRNLNDDTIEGLQLVNFPAFSVQYHPESSPGPHDSRYLFDKFIELMKNN